MTEFTKKEIDYLFGEFILNLKASYELNLNEIKVNHLRLPLIAEHFFKLKKIRKIFSQFIT